MAARFTFTSVQTAVFGQCSSYFAGENRRTRTQEESLSKAKEIAGDWYLQLRGKLRAGEIKSEKTFREVSEQYLREYDIITPGQPNKQYVDGQHWRSNVYLVPFFRNLGISEITAGKSRISEFTDTSKLLANAANHRDIAPCIRKS